MKILVANVGSTSFKFKLYEIKQEIILAEGKIENIGFDESFFKLSSEKNNDSGKAAFPTYKEPIQKCIDFILNKTTAVLNSLDELSAVGFKTVHGKGMIECRFLDENVLGAMEEYNFLAPAHNPPYINAIKIFQNLIPTVPCIGLFEPAFHQHIPEYAYTSGIPYELAEKHGIRKYGFHGASHRYIAERTPEFLGIDKNSKIISCHLGGSSSICAIKNGHSIDTTMAFSPQSGLLNAARCGDLDPFIPLYLQKAEGWSVDEVAEVLQSQSGMKGVSGTSGDGVEIEKAASNGSHQAQLALDTLVYRIQSYIGSYYVALGGLDALVFTAGTGENSQIIREMVIDKLDSLGGKMDDHLNSFVKGEAVISTQDSSFKIAVIPTNEEIVVARESKKLLEKTIN